jgi:hypothetical protein
MDYTMFRTKRIKVIGKILSTTIGPKPLDLAIKLVFRFSFIDFEKNSKPHLLILEGTHSSI